MKESVEAVNAYLNGQAEKLFLKAPNGLIVEGGTWELGFIMIHYPKHLIREYRIENVYNSIRRGGWKASNKEEGLK